MMDVAQRQALRLRCQEFPTGTALTLRVSEVLSLLDYIDETEAKIKEVFNPPDGSHIPLYVNIIRGSVDSQALARRLLSEEDVKKLDAWEALEAENKSLKQERVSERMKM